jgi:flagellar hook-associated protein 2
LSFTSRIAGASGELTIDARGAGGAGADLGLTTLTKGADAQILFGSGDPAQGLLIERPSNTLTDVLPGVTIELHDASDEPVSLTISRDTAAISKAVKGLVTAFNDAIGTIDEYDSYDAGTQSRGPLLGSPTTSRVRAALLNLVQGPALGIDGRFSRLADVGIGLGPGSELVLDEAAFLAAYEEDPDSVEELFTAFEASSTSVQEIAPGVTISRTEQEFTSLGFAELLDRLLDDLTHSLDGTLTLADRTLQDQIDLTNERIEDFDERLEARREQLRREFAAMESALARLHLQSQALQSLAANVAAAQGLL